MEANRPGITDMGRLRGGGRGGVNLLPGPEDGEEGE
jgi:hypothetical protein